MNDFNEIQQIGVSNPVLRAMERHLTDSLNEFLDTHNASMPEVMCVLELMKLNAYQVMVMGARENQ